MTVIVDTSELDRFATAVLGTAGARMKQTADRVVTKTARDVAADAERRAPRRTGELAAGFYVTGSGSEQTVANDTRQAFYQEWGTSRHPPQPSLFPAASKGERDMVDQFEDEIGDL